MRDHTFLLREGRWEAAGTMVDTVGNPDVAAGWSVIRHDASGWHIEGRLNQVETRYDVLPIPHAETATSWLCENSAMGTLFGAFAFFDDLILSTFRSEDDRYLGCESMRMIDEDTYECRGALFLDRGHVSSWSMLLKRVKS